MNPFPLPTFVAGSRKRFCLMEARMRPDFYIIDGGPDFDRHVFSDKAEAVKFLRGCEAGDLLFQCIPDDGLMIDITEDVAREWLDRDYERDGKCPDAFRPFIEVEVERGNDEAYWCGRAA